MRPESRIPATTRLVRWLIVLLVAFPLTLTADDPLDLVDEIDLSRYAGLWYEIALLPNRFQDQCAANTTAEYSLKENGRIRVVNSCRSEDGDTNRAVGEARPADRERPAALEVRFAPKWLSLLPFVWGDYQVMALDEDYRWALVGAPSREFLWILARSPSLPEPRIEALLDAAARQGFEVDGVVRSAQEWP